MTRSNNTKEILLSTMIFNIWSFGGQYGSVVTLIELCCQLKDIITMTQTFDMYNKSLF